MPPPTSPHLPPRTTLRHLVARDFLSHTNEVLAHLLSQYMHEAPLPDIHLGALPAQIRNLALPIRFLAIPDLDLDMDLDAAPALPGAHWLALLAAHLDCDDDTNGSTLELDLDALAPLDELLDDASDAAEQPARTALLDLIMLAQRLLLSSARHNPTHRNTIVTDAVPLRRQNAVRKPCAPQHLAECASALHHDFAHAVRAIRRLDLFLGKSPLFSAHPHQRGPPVRRWACRRARGSNLERAMDRLLLLRRRGRLWPDAPTGEPATHAKRRGDDTASAAKRRKVRPPRRRERVSAGGGGLSVPLGPISASALSRADKYRILDGLPCSYVRSGATYALGLEAGPLKRGRDLLDLTFAHVDHADKSVEGFFCVEALDDRTGDLHLVLSFLSFLCGGPRAAYLVNCTNRVMQTKFALLNETFMAVVVDRGLSNPRVVECLTRALRVPFAGHLVDFNRHDLRFLPDSKPLATKPCFSRAMHVSRMRNEQIRLQLGEWLRIRPFHHFSEAFFLNYLFFVENYLRDFDRAPAPDQEVGVEFAKHLKELIFDIAKDFSFVDDAKIPMAEARFAHARREVWERKRREPVLPLRKSPFHQEWDAKLCDKLGDFVTCEDNCLLNVQLNYVLFTVRVDACAAIDEVFRRFVGLLSKDAERSHFEKKYDALRKQPLALENKDTVFVCSVNRKTGALEMQNTRLYLDYKYAGSCDTRSSLSRSVFSSAFENYSDSDDDDRRLAMLPTKHLEDPYLMGNPTVVAGSWKRTAPRPACACSGGNGKYSFV